MTQTQKLESEIQAFEQLQREARRQRRFIGLIVEMMYMRPDAIRQNSETASA